jgi:hypothetical protein
LYINCPIQNERTNLVLCSIKIEFENGSPVWIFIVRDDVTLP